MSRTISVSLWANFAVGPSRIRGSSHERERPETRSGSVHREAGNLPSLRCRLRRWMPRRRAAWVMLPPQSASTRWMCSHSTRAREGVAGSTSVAGAFNWGRTSWTWPERASYAEGTRPAPRLERHASPVVSEDDDVDAVSEAKNGQRIHPEAFEAVQGASSSTLNLLPRPVKIQDGTATGAAQTSPRRDRA